ncbi:DNA translocase FtsK [Streptomyces sp. NPDC020875]|uniref:DNA translocase FtsK n=1 Tax=Streptomyces sp. NPDC020875 TaxID=3154898 RepID=UPI0033F093D4
MSRQWDWSPPAGHPAFLGYAGETAATAVMLAPLTGMPWQAAAVTLTGAATAGAAWDVRQSTTTGTLVTRGLTWLTAGAWTSWALAAAPLTMTGWASGLGVAAVGLALNASANRTEETRSERKALFVLRRESVGILKDWEDRLERVARIEGCHGKDVRHWPGKVGYTAEMDLPPGGTTADDLAGYGPKCAADMRLPDGCGVEIAPGANRGTILIDVTLEDVVSQDLPYPDDYSDLTLTERFPFGIHRDGEPALGSLCNDCGVLVGETDAGKTNTLRVVTAQLARMPDALIWAIDITGGGVALPWITPWATEGTAAAPVVDWIAHDLAEAKLMLTMAGEIIAARKAGYQQLMREKKSDNKLPITGDIPGLVIVCDETASLPHDVKELLDKVINEGRAMRVRTLTCGLRGTQDVITAAMKLQAKWRVGMTVSDAEELAYLFPGYIKLDPKDAPVAGSGWTMHTRLGPKKPAAFKAWYITDEITDKVCAATAARRPALDPLSANVESGALYPQRWARALPVLYQGQTLTESAQHAVDNAGELIDTTTAITPGPSPAPAPEGGPVPSGYEGFGGAAAELFAAVDAALAGADTGPASVPADPSEADPEPLRAVPQNVVPLQPRPVARPADPRETGLELLTAVGTTGCTPKELHTALRQALGDDGVPAERTVRGWMAKWAEEGKVVADTSGQYTRYISRTAAQPTTTPATSPAVPAAPSPDPSAPDSVASAGPAPDAQPRPGLPEGEDGLLVLQAAELVIATQFATAPMLQRKLRIGWALAGHVLDVLHKLGVVGPAHGSRAHEVLVLPGHQDDTLARLARELGISNADMTAAGLTSHTTDPKE